MRGIPSPGAITYGLPGGVEVLAKHWHNKRMSVIFEELASGKVKFSIWKVNKSARQEFLFASQRLQKILRDEPPQADPPAPEDVSIISEQEMVDWSPEQRKEHTEKLEKFYRYRRIKNTIDEDNSHEPGSWICSRCFSANAPTVRICEGLYGPSGDDPNNIDVSLVVRCDGNLVATWGGYVNIDERTETPEAFIYKASHPLTRGAFQRGRDRQRRWARVVLAAEENEGQLPEDEERAAIVRKVLNARTRLRNARERGRTRNRASQVAHRDPYSWICSYCQVGGDDPQDTYNDYGRLHCYHCSKRRPPSDSYRNWRWFCNGCADRDYHKFHLDAEGNKIGST